MVGVQEGCEAPSVSIIDVEESTQNSRPKGSYREVIGCLLWLSMGTRPDITYAVSQRARYSSDP